MFSMTSFLGFVLLVKLHKDGPLFDGNDAAAGGCACDDDGTNDGTDDGNMDDDGATFVSLVLIFVYIGSLEGLCMSTLSWYTIKRNDEMIDFIDIYI